MIFHSKSVVNPIAMINKHVQTERIRPAEVNDIGQKLEANAGYLGNYFYLFLLLQSSGARFSEVQEVKTNQISRDGKVMIIGKKRSHDRVINNEKCTQFLLKCKSNQIEPFNGCNVYTANRLLKNIGLFKQKKGRVRLTVSGIFRDEFASQVRSIQREPGTLTRSIGHKSKANDEYYGRD